MVERPWFPATAGSSMSCAPDTPSKPGEQLHYKKLPLPAQRRDRRLQGCPAASPSMRPWSAPARAVGEDRVVAVFAPDDVTAACSTPPAPQDSPKGVMLTHRKRERRQVHRRPHGPRPPQTRFMIHVPHVPLLRHDPVDDLVHDARRDLGSDALLQRQGVAALHHAGERWPQLQRRPTMFIAMFNHGTTRRPTSATCAGMAGAAARPEFMKRAAQP